MSPRSAIISVSMPRKLAKAIDKVSQETFRARSELVRNAVSDYLAEMEEDRLMFLKAYDSTRNEKIFTLEEIRKKYHLS